MISAMAAADSMADALRFAAAQRAAALGEAKSALLKGPFSNCKSFLQFKKFHYLLFYQIYFHNHVVNNVSIILYYLMPIFDLYNLIYQFKDLLIFFLDFRFLNGLKS